MITASWPHRPANAGFDPTQRDRRQHSPRGGHFYFALPPDISMTMGSVVGSLVSYQLRGTPTHYLIGSDGRVKHSAVGSLLEIPSWLN